MIQLLEDLGFGLDKSGYLSSNDSDVMGEEGDKAVKGEVLR